ncbi:MAG: 4-amino-4-deoxy-L-arabinose transferase [Betaproteobacteria bacterium]|nr:4-amino-4-deoxy-L-arabinose transferase [Betaproteobacteria bacterium]
MNATSFGLILLGVLFNAAAQIFLKAGTQTLGVISFTRENWWTMSWAIGTEPRFLGGFACYAISLVVWIMALSRVPVSVAYPMLSIGYIVNALAAWKLLGEHPLSGSAWTGIGLIVLGVYLVARDA